VNRVHRDEQGAALILAIVFLVIVGGIVAAGLSSITSGLNDRNILDAARQREYSADSAIDFAIATVRTMPAPTVFSGPGYTPCGPYSYELNSINGNVYPKMRVDCTPAGTTSLSGFQQRDVVFAACIDVGQACGGPSAPIVIRAQVNYEAAGTDASYQVTHTWIQSWSVNA
jgi:hypothetical protein